MTDPNGSAALAVIERIQRAANAHDIDAFADCFTEDYLSEIPVHPDRDFRGREQVRQNWSHIFVSVPDLEQRLVRVVTDGDTGWAEWEWRGTRLDGARHLMRGVTIIGARDGRAAWARFYMEPVDADGVAVEESIRRTLTGPPAAASAAETDR